MKSELPSIETGETTLLHSREVEYALILSQMVSIAEQDPSQMRLAIYEFARAKLNHNTVFTDDRERRQLSAALEAAILGVEKFSAIRDEQQRASSAAVPLAGSASSQNFLPQPTLVAAEVLGSRQDTSLDHVALAVVRSPWVQASWHYRFAIVLSVASMVAIAAFAWEMRPSWRGDRKMAATAPAVESTKQAASSQETAAAPKPALPSDYGVYAYDSDSKLIELDAMAQQVPDPRIAMSAPIAQPSRTILAHGKPKFVIYRRELAGSTPDRLDVRTVARVKKVTSFDAKGKPLVSDAPASWIIRNISHEFRVRPIPGSPEMLLVQSRDADAELPPGRYVLAVKDQGYDFTVDGEVVDRAQCLERTDAANGSFYSDCQSP